MIKKILNRILSFFKIPPEAVKMFGAANDLSGLNKDNLPVELLPLNTIQFSRGLMNFTFFQTNLSWILPYWAEMQFNYNSFSFIPRSHLGMSMNVTQRNWTAVGNPDCITEPIVDPRGLITPYRNSWSIDVWYKTHDGIIFPSKLPYVRQKLVEDLPLIETVIFSGGYEFSSKVYTYRGQLFIQPNCPPDINCSVIFSIRPYNPEGISLINHIVFNKSKNQFTVNKKDVINFNYAPVKVYCSGYADGDALSGLTENEDVYSSKCEFGLASAVAEFDVGKNNRDLVCSFSLDGIADPKINHQISDAADKWHELLSKGTMLSAPDEKLNSIYKFSLSSLLMFTDIDNITPGPFTYHQFWIRDAVYMINTLDKTGYSFLTGKIINNFKQYQDKRGYFRSQKGEWDSNGQVLWLIFRHAMLSGNYKILGDNFNSLLKSLNWIADKRLKNKKYKKDPYFGLLPSGLSAEHLGAADFYYWDNFWSLAGISAFTEICGLLGMNNEAGKSIKLFEDYLADVNASLRKVQKKYSINSIPASCTRGLDCGMIGSICALYPLQLFPDKDDNISNTADVIYSSFFFKGMFFQNIIHSGMNAYLSLQVAHSYLYAGNRKRFIKILYSVLEKASDTLTYPEAIHPFTGGGVMGDGHHGWAAAEIVSALRDAFIYENTVNSVRLNEYILLAGIPAGWFTGDTPFGLQDAVVFDGIISLLITPDHNRIKIETEAYFRTKNRKTKFSFKIPLSAEKIVTCGKEIPFSFHTETQITLPDLPPEITIFLA